ncbi:MAG: GxxExxY protein [Deltaproteobacteria bacterium]|nr:MAG: GxxExxY protein [Deltaproteobacteria bacterium]
MEEPNGQEDRIAKIIVNAAFKVHNKLGPGLLEKIYEACLAYELESAGCKVARQVAFPVMYEDLVFEEGYRVDLLVEDSVIVELKAAEKPHPVWQAQLLSYMKLANKRLGLLINFNTTLFKDGVQRLVNSRRL